MEQLYPITTVGWVDVYPALRNQYLKRLAKNNESLASIGKAFITQLRELGASEEDIVDCIYDLRKRFSLNNCLAA